MSSGFNTDVRVGEKVFHVQTEDRGPMHPAIDTAVYQNGRVLHRRSSNYEQFVASEEFSTDELRRRVETQHRAVIDDLRSGALDAEIAAAALQAARAAGIQVQLLNPSSWLSGGHVSLDLEISRRGDGQPEVGAEVEAVIEGALENARHAGISDESGRLNLQFPLPPLGKGDLALVIQARKETSKDEIRFTMRSRSKAPTA
ncbi:MAG TPA: hypothetical protein VEX69_08675 [Candidatus Limnocylindria bacterium]|nr:hypothetical protein [Candidatus Limnocylindria bacterium]